MNAMTHDLRQVATQEIKRGNGVIPLPFKQKGPTIEGWPALKLTEENLHLYFNGQSQNVGRLFGDQIGDLVDLDLDCPEALLAAEMFFPPTGEIHGRASKPRSHRWYKSKKTHPTYKKFSDVDGTCILEIRTGAGKQTMIPPSVHPSGELLEWERYGNPAEVNGEELQRLAACTAACALLARHWPSQGVRQDFALALAGFLLRGGFEANVVHQILECAAQVAGDEEAQKRASVVCETNTKIQQGGQVTGGPTLIQLVGASGEQIVNRLIDWLELRRAPSTEIFSVAQPEPVADFPIEVFPKAVRLFISQVAISMHGAVDLPGTFALAALGAAIGTSRAIEIKKGWIERPCLYVAGVADAGEKKSPTLKAIMRPFFMRQSQLSDAHKAALEQYKERKREAVSRQTLFNEELPVMAQVFTTDSTMEALAEKLEQNPRGLVYLQDELTMWVAALNQYKGGKGSDKQKWLSFWNGVSELINRKRQSAIYLQNPYVSVAGCIPPAFLSNLYDERSNMEDGFIHRIIFSFPESSDPGFSESVIGDEVIAGYVNVFENIWRLEPDKDANGNQIAKVICFSGDGRERFKEILDGHYREMRETSFPANLRGPWSKLEAYFFRFALILHVSYLAAGEAQGEDVGETAVLGAALLLNYFKNHARKVYKRLTASKEDLQSEKAQAWIAKRGGTATVRDVQIGKVGGVKNAIEARTLLEALVTRGMGRMNGNTFELFQHSTGGLKPL